MLNRAVGEVVALSWRSVSSTGFPFVLGLKTEWNMTPQYGCSSYTPNCPVEVAALTPLPDVLLFVVILCD
jgi:hypothetical protein